MESRGTLPELVHGNRLRYALYFGGFTVLALTIVIALGGAAMPFFAGAALAYIAIPLVDRLEKWGCRQTLGAFIVTLFICGAFIALLIVLVPLIIEQAAAFMAALPGTIEKIKSQVVAFLDTRVPGVSEAALSTEQLSVTSLMGQNEEAANQAADIVFSAVDLILFTVLTPFVCFFLLRDGHKVVDGFLQSFPQKQRSTVRYLLHEIHLKLSGLVRGQSLVIVSQAVLHTFGLMLIGLDNAVLLGVLTGISALVPVIGNLTMFGVAFAAALTQFTDIVPALLVCLLYGGSQVLETAVLSPWLVGQNVQTHPLWILFGLLVGGSLLGFTGAVLALPVVVVTDAFVRFVMTERERLDQDTWQLGQIATEETESTSNS